MGKPFEHCLQLGLAQNSEMLSLLVKAEMEVSPVCGCRGNLSITVTSVLSLYLPDELFVISLVPIGSFPSQLSHVLVYAVASKNEQVNVTEKCERLRLFITFLFGCQGTPWSLSP